MINRLTHDLQANIAARLVSVLAPFTVHIMCERVQDENDNYVIINRNFGKDEPISFDDSQVLTGYIRGNGKARFTPHPDDDGCLTQFYMWDVPMRLFIFKAALQSGSPSRLLEIVGGVVTQFSTLTGTSEGMDALSEELPTLDVMIRPDTVCGYIDFTIKGSGFIKVCEDEEDECMLDVVFTSTGNGTYTPQPSVCMCDVDFQVTETHVQVNINDAGWEDLIPLEDITGEDGEDGQDGNDGADGDSAYQTWLDLGNVGTEQDFIDSLQGADGQDGNDGQDGSDGDSAYVYIAYADDASGTGFTNTFNASKDYIAILSTDTEILAPAVGDFAGLWKKYKGEQGDAGDDGQDGQDGADGVVPIVIAGGTADAMTLDYTPNTTLTDLTLIAFRAIGANTITNPTVNPDTLGAKTIVKYGNKPLAVGDIPRAGFVGFLQYNLANDNYELLNPRTQEQTEGAYEKPVTGVAWTVGGIPPQAVSDGVMGILYQAPNAGGYSYFYRSGLAPANGFTASLRVDGVCLNQTTNGYGIFIRNSTSGRIAQLNMVTQSGTIVSIQSQTFSVFGGFNANILGATVNIAETPKWFRISMAAGVFSMYLSNNGLDWFLWTSQSLGTYINAAGGQVDQAGFFTINTAAGFNRILVSSFGIIVPT